MAEVGRSSKGHLVQNHWLKQGHLELDVQVFEYLQEWEVPNFCDLFQCSGAFTDLCNSSSKVSSAKNAPVRHVWDKEVPFTSFGPQWLTEPQNSWGWLGHKLLTSLQQLWSYFFCLLGPRTSYLKASIKLFLSSAGESRKDGEGTVVEKNLLTLLWLTVAAVKEKEEICDHVKWFLRIAVRDAALKHF